MSQVIDNRVVEMVFDNKNFEKGVGQTLNSLENLDKGLNKIDGKSLDSISASANNVDLSRISEGVDALTKRFSTLGIVGMSVVNKLTTGIMGLVGKGLNQIVHGGLSRALNLEQASFMLHNTFKDAKNVEAEVEKVMNAVNDSVVGTRYGYDEAAKAASQLAASGIEVGKGMEEALAGMAGVATIANTDYESISNIFTAVAGQGFVMTQQLRQLELRGINAAAEIAKYMGKTETEVREMVSKKEIDFKTFSAAMADAFGESSKKANETFTGALANMKAALSRIGQGFMVPYIENMREIFVALIPVFDGIKKAIAPLVAVYEYAFGRVKDVVVGFLNSLVQLDKKGKFKDFAGKLEPIVNVINKLIKLDKNGKFVGPGQLLIRMFGELRSRFSEHKATFQGIIDLFHILGFAIKNVTTYLKNSVNAWHPIGSLVRLIVTNLGSNFLFLTDRIGEAISKFREFLQAPDENPMTTALYYISRAIWALNDALEWVFENVMPRVDTVIRAVAGSLLKIAKAVIVFVKSSEIIPRTLGRIKEALARVKEGLAGYADGFNKVGGSLKNFALWIKNTELPKLLDKLSLSAEKLGKVFKIVGSAIGSGIHALLSVLKPGDFRPLLQLVNGGLITAILYGMSNMFRTFNGFIKKFESGQLIKMGKGGPMLSVMRTLDQLRDTLFAYERTIKADIILKIAAAVAILAGSLWLLSALDQKKLMGAIVALGDLLAMLTASFVIINKMLAAEKTPAGIASSLSTMYTYTRVGTMLLLMAGAILVLAEAARRLAALNPEELARGLKGVSVLMLALMGMLTTITLLDRSKHASGLKGIVRTGLGLLLMAEGIKILATAVEKMGKLDTDTLVKGLASVVSLISALTLFTVAAKDSKRMTSVGIGILILSEALLVLGKAVAMFGAMDPEVLIKGLGSVIALLVSLGAYTRMAGGAKRMITTSVGILILVEALKRLWDVVLSFGVTDTKVLAKGLISVAAALGVMAGSLLIIKKAGSGLRSSASIYILVKALTELTGVIKNLGAMNGDNITKAIVSIAGALLVMGGAMRLMGGNMLGAAGIFVLAEALKVLVPVMQTLAYMPGEKIAKAIVAMAAAFGVLGVTAAVLAPLVAPLMGLAAAIALLGAAAFAFGAGIALLGVGFSALSSLTSDGLTTITETLGFIASAIGGFITSLGEHAGEFAEAGMKILIAFLDGIANNIGHIAGTAFTIIEEFIRKLTEKAPDLIDAGFDLLISVINGLASAIYERSSEITGAIDRLLGSLIYFALEALKTLAKHLPGGEYIAQWIDGLEDEVVLEFNLDQAEEAGEDLIDSSADGANKALEKGEIDEAGKKSTGHYVSGVKSKKDEVRAATSYLASESASGFESENGPNGGHYNAGVNAAQGFLNGLNSKIDDIKEKAKEMAEASSNATKKGLKEQSPSRVFIGIGRYVGEGFVIGIESYKDKVAAASSDMAGMSIDTVNSLSKRLAESMSDDTLHPTIRPVLDLSDVRSGYGTLNSMFGGVSLGTSMSFAADASESMRTNQNGSQIAASAADRLIRKMNDLEAKVAASRIDPELMYEAVYAGASSAKPAIRINNRELNRELRDMGVVYR